ncbi:MAG TPA: energy-coupling factor ABC transporter ATP-binding protein, partial [Clostridiales bacterium]|nr:energy-coupling factor ABC transporter ATP-binding protein [Clostridiales bacterium]
MSIKIDQLSFFYSQGTPFETKALDDITMEIKNGDFVGIIGQTGSGKSTLIQHFNGLILPEAGTVYIDGTNIKD